MLTSPVELGAPADRIVDRVQRSGPPEQ
jgi:hypothetical protein